MSPRVIVSKSSSPAGYDQTIWCASAVPSVSSLETGKRVGFSDFSFFGFFQCNLLEAETKDTTEVATKLKQKQYLKLECDFFLRRLGGP